MKNYFDLSGQTAVVTGASTGLGLQMAKAFASQGANLVLLTRRQNLTRTKQLSRRNSALRFLHMHATLQIRKKLRVQLKQP